MLSMGYLTKVQAVERGKGQRSFYLICPAALAQALEIEKGETIEWVVEDKWTLKIRRGEAKAAQARRRNHER
jgi:antitoxin component of MazEF toxin-antitoxin module